MGKALVKFLQDRSGTSAIEYCVMACFVSLVLLGTAQIAGLRVAMTLKHLAVLMVYGNPVLTP